MSLPADITPLVTNLEIVAFVTGMNDTIGVLETTVISSAADMVEDYCQRKFSVTTYTDEAYLLRRTSQSFDNYITHPITDLRLKQRPVTAVSAVKVISSRDETTGAPVNPSTVAKSLYRVDLPAGIITFYGPIGVDPHTQFNAGVPLVNNMLPYAPTNMLDMLVTYSAGYASNAIPSRLKLAILMVISRMHKMAKLQFFNVDEVQNTGISMVWQTLHRAGFTPEEKEILDRFKTPMVS